MISGIIFVMRNGLRWRDVPPNYGPHKKIYIRFVRWSELHAVCDSQGRPRSFFLTAGQVSDYTATAALLATMPPAKVLLADRSYEADRLRDAPAERQTEACIPSKSNRKIPISHDRVRYRKRHKIENVFARL